MPRVCTICTHERRGEIDRALVGGTPYRDVSGRFGTSKSALERHKAEHLPALLAQVKRDEESRAVALVGQVEQQAADETAHALDVMTELRRCFDRVNLLFDACDRWLRDPDDPSRYDVGPRANDVQVIYTELVGDNVVAKKAKLSALLARLEDAGVDALRGETRYADPRELILKTAARLQGNLELLAKLLGDLDERPHINVLVGAEWQHVRAELVDALGPYPDARGAVAARLLALEAAS